MVVSDTHKEFINGQIEKLADYDSQRPKGHVYEFHLHSKRVAQSMKKLALAMGYDQGMANTLYWATLPHDIGKMTLPVELWDMVEKPSEAQRESRRAHTIEGVKIIQKEFENACDKDPFLKLMTDIMLNHHENTNGSGYLGKTADELSQETRMACICDAFDGYSVHRKHFGDRDLSPSAVIERMEIEKHGQFDDKILKIFKEITLCQ